MLNSCKMVEKQCEAFHMFLSGLFSKFKTEFYCISFFKVSSRPNCIFEIHHLWQSGFSRVYSNSCCSCSFESEIIKIGQSSHKKYSNNILNFQESMTILNACTKKVWKIIEGTTYSIAPSKLGSIHICIYVCVCAYIYIYIYILKSVYLGSKLLFKQVLLKTMNTIYLLFLIVIFQAFMLIFLCRDPGGNWIVSYLLPNCFWPYFW